MRESAGPDCPQLNVMATKVSGHPLYPKPHDETKPKAVKASRGFSDLVHKRPRCFGPVV